MEKKALLETKLNESVEDNKRLVAKHALCYIHIGVKKDYMPLSITYRSYDGTIISQKQTGLKLLSTINNTETPRPFSIVGKVRGNTVVVHGIDVQKGINSNGDTILKKYRIDETILDDDDDDVMDVNPSTWICDAVSGVYTLVATGGGLFKLEIYTEKTKPQPKHSMPIIIQKDV